MGRSGGSNKGATPDWLKTAEEREGPSLNRREQRAAYADDSGAPWTRDGQPQSFTVPPEAVSHEGLVKGLADRRQDQPPNGALPNM